jgi:hypothetical protein
MFVFILVLLAAVVFEYINGFHDAANAIATVVSTKVLSPRQALTMAVFFNLLGAFIGTEVAKTISSGIVDTSVVEFAHVVAGAAVEFQPCTCRGLVRRGAGKDARRLVGAALGARVGRPVAEGGAADDNIAGPGFFWRRDADVPAACFSEAPAADDGAEVVREIAIGERLVDGLEPWQQ